MVIVDKNDNKYQTARRWDLSIVIKEGACMNITTIWFDLFTDLSGQTAKKLWSIFIATFCRGMMNMVHVAGVYCGGAALLVMMYYASRWLFYDWLVAPLLFNGFLGLWVLVTAWSLTVLAIVYRPIAYQLNGWGSVFLSTVLIRFLINTGMVVLTVIGGMFLAPMIPFDRWFWLVVPLIGLWVLFVWVFSLFVADTDQSLQGIGNALVNAVTMVWYTAPIAWVVGIVMVGIGTVVPMFFYYMMLWFSRSPHFFASIYPLLILWGFVFFYPFVAVVIQVYYVFIVYRHTGWYGHPQ